MTSCSSYTSWNATGTGPLSECQCTRPFVSSSKRSWHWQITLSEPCPSSESRRKLRGSSLSSTSQFGRTTEFPSIRHLCFSLCGGWWPQAPTTIPCWFTAVPASGEQAHSFLCLPSSRGSELRTMWTSSTSSGVCASTDAVWSRLR